MLSQRLSMRSARGAVVRLVSVTVLAGLTAIAPAANASASPTPDNTARVDCVAFDAQGQCSVLGTVYAVAAAGNRTIIGGSFNSIGGVPRQNLAAINPDGTLDTSWDASTNGVVYALAASSDGDTVYVGGGFTTIGGVDRSRLAAVDAASGVVSSTWTTTANNNLVRALATDAGDRLYVGGNFGRIGGRAIPRLAAVSQSSGVVDASFTPQPNGTIRALTVSDDGTKLYSGGGFSSMGGAARKGAAEVTAATGTVTSFAPSDGGVVISIDVSPSGRLFFGTTSNRTWAYDPAVSNTGLYRVRTGGDVQAILATDSKVFIGGHFNTMPEAKVARVGIASILPANGQPTAWNPGANGPFGVWTIAITNNGTKLAIGGDSTRVGGVARRGYTPFHAHLSRLDAFPVRSHLNRPLGVAASLLCRPLSRPGTAVCPPLDPGRRREDTAK